MGKGFQDGNKENIALGYHNMQIDSPVLLCNDISTQLDLSDNDEISKSPSIDASISQPVKTEKKQTRQWAAWTRLEEENFFTALRLVGKNFEKITRRVQSKNKNQVRYYYYRLVRRLNKLLGPELFLDAKNSKDTNAAMLRWWSLLEKYSCKASRHHLKPRRFKTFVETLGHQLLKDQKKNKIKRSLSRENTSANSTIIPNNEMEKGSSLKCNINVGSCDNGDSDFTKIARKRRKQDSGSVKAYKRWEKAVIAGVSLVADAAEHLERTAINSKADNNEHTLGQNGVDPVVESQQPEPANASQKTFYGKSILEPIKIKLQLFPIDEATRNTLEMDKHNPYLELTLSSRKKISSVLEHLNRKWGSSSVAAGQLLLFPYGVQREHLVRYPRWDRDSMISATDVHTLIGSPPVFRLRYGWFTDADFELLKSGVSLQSNLGKHNMDSAASLVSCSGFRSKEFLDSSELQTKAPVEKSILSDNRCPLATIAEAVHKNADEVEGRSDVPLSVNDWADSLINLSVGDLLLELPQEVDEGGTVDKPINGCFQYFHPATSTCDSFDAAIAAHLSKHKEPMPPSIHSILDSEETCDGFAFKNVVVRQEFPSSSGFSSVLCKEDSRISFGDFAGVSKPENAPGCQSDDPLIPNTSKHSTSLTDLYWPESLGLMDMEPSCGRYHQSEDGGIMGDSFQCTLFAVPSPFDNSFPNFQISSGV